MALDVETVKEYLDYDKDTGEFFWKKSNSNRIKAGDRAGSLSKNGYLTIRILGKSYYCHRLAYAISYGKWPEKMIDHINGIRTDNRIVNLRSANGTQNCGNSKILSTNTSGVRGVSWAKDKSKWSCYIWINNKKKHLGHFDDLEEAKMTYSRAALNHFGEFAPTGRVD